MARTSIVVVPDAVALRQAVDSYIVSGYVVATQDAQSATMIRRKQFSIPIAIVGFFFCVIGLVIYAIVYAGQSDEVARVVIGLPELEPLHVSDDGAWWWSAPHQRWVNVREGLPGGCEMSPDGKWWWDRSSWRRLPAHPELPAADHSATTGGPLPPPTV